MKVFVVKIRNQNIKNLKTNFSIFLCGFFDSRRIKIERFHNFFLYAAAYFYEFTTIVMVISQHASLSIIKNNSVAKYLRKIVNTY